MEGVAIVAAVAAAAVAAAFGKENEGMRVRESRWLCLYVLHELQLWRKKKRCVENETEREDTEEK